MWQIDSRLVSCSDDGDNFSDLGKRRKKNFKNFEHFNEINRVYCLTRHIKHWREVLFFKQLLEQKAIPHFENIVTMKNLRGNVLKALKNNVEHNHIKKEKTR
jgi:hypothetical protein